jgi:hypothetical protein
MPNYFSLTRKKDKEAGPVSLSQIDNEMCQAFGIVPNPGQYYHTWVDTIGLKLALGQSFDEIIRETKEGMNEYPDSASYYETKLKIAEYLNENFISAAWTEISNKFCNRKDKVSRKYT